MKFYSNNQSFLNQIPSLHQDSKLSSVENSFDYLDNEIPPVRTTVFLKSNNKENLGQSLKVIFYFIKIEKI